MMDSCPSISSQSGPPDPHLPMFLPYQITERGMAPTRRGSDDDTAEAEAGRQPMHLGSSVAPNQIWREAKRCMEPKGPRPADERPGSLERDANPKTGSILAGKGTGGLPRLNSEQAMGCAFA